MARAGTAGLGRSKDKLAGTRRVVADRAGGLVAGLPGRLDALLDQVSAHARRGLAAGSNEVARSSQCVGEAPAWATRHAALRLGGLADAVRTSAMGDLRRAKTDTEGVAEFLPCHAARVLAAADKRLQGHPLILATVPGEKTVRQASRLHARAEIVQAVGTSRSTAATHCLESLAAVVRSTALRKLERAGTWTITSTVPTSTGPIETNPK